MRRRFVSEGIAPVDGTFDRAGMALGEPALPLRFKWRGEEYAVANVLEKWRETSPCSHGGGEQYVRKHWFRIATTGGIEMRIYFERQARSKREKKSRWWLHSLAGNDGEAQPT